MKTKTFTYVIACMFACLSMMSTSSFALPPDNGTGVVTVTAAGGSCIGFTPAVGNGPDNWEVAEGGSYTMTITGVTECNGSAITVFIQNSNTGNFCFTATGGSGTYVGTFTVPSPSCNTMPVSYKCGANQPCDNADTYNANGPSNNNKVHLRANTFGAGCSNPSEDEDCNSTICICTPPTTFTVDSISPVAALLCWDSIACADGYIVAWRKQGSNKLQFRTVTAPDHCTVFTNNYPTIFEIQVATICDGDTTAFSDIFVFYTFPSCLPPTNLYTDNILATQATAHWTPGSDAAKQNFWYRKVGDATWISKNLSATATSYTMTNLLPNTSYEWKVRSSCSDGTRQVKGAFSEVQTFTTTAARLAINENPGTSLNIYPNPSGDGNFVIVLSLNSSIDHATITITDLVGRVIHQQQATINDGMLSQPVKLGEGIPAGTYMVRIIAAENVYTTQLVYQY